MRREIIGVVGMTAWALGMCCITVANAIDIAQKLKRNKQIKDGLKDGSIIEINGKYYEVEIPEYRKDEYRK